MLMLFHELIRPSVGADLSRPPPIYRPVWLVRYLRISLFICISICWQP